MVSDGQGWHHVTDVPASVLGTLVWARDGGEEGALNAWKIELFPRTSKAFRVDFLVGSEPRVVARFVIQNPALRPPTKWEPERLPSTKQDEDIAFTLTALETGVAPADEPPETAEPAQLFTQGPDLSAQLAAQLGPPYLWNFAASLTASVRGNPESYVQPDGSFIELPAGAYPIPAAEVAPIRAVTARTRPAIAHPARRMLIA